MQELYTFNLKDFDENWDKFYREAVRAVIFNNKKIAMVKSGAAGFFKFPGGGIENNETHMEALIRETSEETGLQIIPQSIKEYGYVEELRKSIFKENEIFNQKSFFYFADVYNDVFEKNLSESEKKLDFQLEFTDLKTAFDINTEINKKTEFAFLKRETYVISLLLNNYKI